VKNTQDINIRLILRKAKMSKSRGLGDDIKKITSAIRLDELAKKISDLTSSDCGCDERQEKLNKMFPYKNKGKK